MPLLYVGKYAVSSQKRFINIGRARLYVFNFYQIGSEKASCTGGEPLVRRDIMKFFERISRHLQTDLLEELTLTTNGSQLRRFSMICTKWAFVE